jgi:hypothetical protein
VILNIEFMFFWLGIPYWNHQQEADAMSRYGMHNKNEDIPEDDENRAFIQETKYVWIFDFI